MPHGHESFITKVQRTIDRYEMLGDGLTVVVAVSGGPDSVALLYVLVELRERRYPSLRLHVAHMNHQLRGAESDQDEDFVRALADHFGLAFTATRRNVRALAERERRNLEEIARRERYRFLRHTATEVEAARIATGHTLTDQAETILMRLVRGAGGEGLSGIHPVVDDLIVRPLLGVTREEVLAYCESVGATYRMDRSNWDPTRTRNRIRHEILPRMKALNPEVEMALGRAAEHLRRDETYFDLMVSQLLPGCLRMRDSKTLCLSVVQCEALHPAIRRRLLRAVLCRLRGDLRRITHAHLEAVERLLQSGMSGKRVDLPGCIVWREFDQLTFTVEGPLVPPPQDLTECRSIRWGKFQLHLRRGLGRGDVDAVTGEIVLDDDKLPRQLRVRARRPGDRYVPVGHDRPRKLKRLMIEHRIPVTERDRWPVIVNAEDDVIVAVPQLPAVATVAPGPQTRTWATITVSE